MLKISETNTVYKNRVFMTTYASEEDYIEDQISSFKNAKKTLKKYQRKIGNELHEDFTGERDKVLKGLQMGLKYLDIERQKLETKLNILKK